MAGKERGSSERLRRVDGDGLGGPRFLELPKYGVCLDKLLARSLAIALGAEKVAGLDKPAACVSRQADARQPEATKARAISASNSASAGPEI